MGNKIRIKQIDLQGVFSSSAQVNLLSASDYVSFVTQLDTTMSTDLELAAVSSSISQSIYDLSRTFGANNTLVSGASQLTSSYDQRYVLSGSITQTTWNNISGKPAGIVSQSTDLTSLNAFTASNGTTQLNLATSSYETKGRGIVSGSSQLTASYDTRYETRGRGILSGSVSYTSLTNIPTGIVSQSVSLSSLNAFTASYFIDSASIDSRVLTEKGRIDAILSASTANADTFAEIVTLINSVDTTNDNAFATYYTSSNARITSLENTTSSYETKGRGILSGSFYATTGSNTFVGNQYISGTLYLNNVQFSTSASVGVTTGSVYISNNIKLSGSVNTLQDVLSFTLPSNGIWELNYGGESSNYNPNNGSGQESYIYLTDENNNVLDNSGLLIIADNNSSYTAGSSFRSYFITTNSATIYKIRGFGTGYNQLSQYKTGVSYKRLDYFASANVPYGTISGSSQLTSSLDLRYATSASYLTSLNGAFSSSIQTLGGSGVYSSSAQLPSGLISGSSQLPSGLVSGSSQLTGSYDTRYTLSGSIGATPAGTISGSSQLTSSLDLRYETIGRGIVSGSSQLTASYDTRYALSSSVSSISSSFNSRFTGLVTTGSNTFSGSQIFSGSMTVSSGQVIASTITNNSSSLYLTSGSNLYVQNNGIVEITGSIVLNGTTYTSLTGSVTIPAGTISGSSQLTSSFDTRYAPSASYLTSLNGAISSSTQITNGSGIVSGSSQLTASYDTRYTLSGSVSAVPAGTISGSSQLTSSLDLRYETKGSGIISGSSQLTASYDSRYLTFGGDNVISGSSQLTSSFETVGRGIISSSAQLPSGLISGSSQLPNGIVSGSSQLTSSYDTRYTLSGSISAVPAGTISGSSQLTASFDTRYAPSASYLTSLNGAISSSTQVTNGSGIISGSSQLTASFDVRYALSGSGGSATIPAGTVSGSSQLTSSYDGRYTLTSSFNAFTASAQAVTTGSNSFNGTQTITGSLIITTGSFFASQLVANTASLYLTSGSNLYVQNNGLVEITGSIIATSITGSIAATNGVISGSSQLTASYDTRYTLSGSISSVPAGTVSGSSQLTSSYDLRYEGVGRGIVSGSTQLTASFETIGRGIISSSAQLPNALVSGSSQLTASYDLRYEGVGKGIVSGSSQLTSSFDSRYLQTGSFNLYTASINSYTSSNDTTNTTQNSRLTALENKTGSLATTGSNTFIGTETINGSLLVSGSTILTGSLSISSGSITMPNRPAFRVVGTTGDRTAPLTLSGSLVSVEYNEGNYFSTTNGKFTAPTAGLYHVYYNGRVGSVNAMQQVIVYKNSNVVQLMWESSTNTGAAHFGVSGIVKLAVNDTLEAKVAVGTIQFDANDSWGVAYIG